MVPITLLMPVRNGAQYVDGIMQGLIANADSGDEILVIDDGSTDKTPELLHAWSNKFPNFRILTTPGIGLVNSLNLGFSESDNEWVARFDVDDAYPDLRLAKQRELISEKISVIFADYSVYLDGVKYAGTIPSPVTHLATLLSLVNSQQTAHPVSLINKKSFNFAGGYQEDEFPAEDLGLWVRMAKFGELISVPESLLSYRLSKTSVSATRRSQALEKKGEIVEKLIPLISKNLDSADKVRQVFEGMSGAPLEVDRKILYLRNLRTFLKMAGKEKMTITADTPNFYKYLITHPFNVLRFAFYQNRRNRFRRI